MVGLINKEDIYDIADAIREKTQTEDTFKPSEMGDLIRSIRVIPENSYQLKEIESTPTSLATFDADALPMPSLKVGIEPIQEGSGDPSPTNVRPISGWSGANVVVSPTTDAEDGQTYTIDLDGTRYGGTLDVVSGELVVDRAMVDLGSLTWLNNALKTNAFEAYVITSLVKPYTANLISNALVQKPSFEDVAEYTIRMGDNFLAVKVPKSVATNGTQVKQWLTDNAVTLCYELATPQTIQLTPTQVKSLLGTNNVWADTGNILEGEYFKAL